MTPTEIYGDDGTEMPTLDRAEDSDTEDSEDEDFDDAKAAGMLADLTKLNALAWCVMQTHPDISVVHPPEDAAGLGGRPRVADPTAKRNHVGCTSRASRASADVSKIKDSATFNAAPARSSRVRKPPAAFEAGATAVRGSRQDKPRRADVPPPQSKERAYNRRRAEQRRAVRAAFVSKLEEMVDKDFVDISWSQRRAFAVSSFCEALSRGKSKMEAYGVASMAARVHPSTARAYIADYLKNEGFFSPCNWGEGTKVPTFFHEETIRLQSSRWWRDHGIRRGTCPCPIH